MGSFKRVGKRGGAKVKGHEGGREVIDKQIESIIIRKVKQAEEGSDDGVEGGEGEAPGGHKKETEDLESCSHSLRQPHPSLPSSHLSTSSPNLFSSAAALHSTGQPRKISE